MPDDTIDPRTSIRLKDPSLLSQRCYVDGRWTDALSGATMNVINPATGSRIGAAPWMGADDTKGAIAAAAAAFPGWRANDLVRTTARCCCTCRKRRTTRPRASPATMWR